MNVNSVQRYGPWVLAVTGPWEDSKKWKGHVPAFDHFAFNFEICSGLLGEADVPLEASARILSPIDDADSVASDLGASTSMVSGWLPQQWNSYRGKGKGNSWQPWQKVKVKGTHWNGGKGKFGQNGKDGKVRGESLVSEPFWVYSSRPFFVDIGAVSGNGLTRRIIARRDQPEGMLELWSPPLVVTQCPQPVRASRCRECAPRRGRGLA